MTKNERTAIMRLLSSVRRAANEAKMYGRDYDTKTVESIGTSLDEAADKFRKEVKL